VDHNDYYAHQSSILLAYIQALPCSIKHRETPWPLASLSLFQDCNRGRRTSFRIPSTNFGRILRRPGMNLLFQDHTQKYNCTPGLLGTNENTKDIAWRRSF